MVISQPPRNNPSYYYRASVCLNCSECFQRHLMFYTCNYNIRVTHRKMVLLSIFFTRIRSTEGSSADVLYSFCRSAALALHLAVKILLQIFLYLKIWARWPYIHLSVVFPSRMPAGPHFVTQPILLSENIPNIWHKSSAKHKEVRPDWNDKNDKCKLRALVSHGRFYQWLQGCHFKEIFDQVRKDLDCNCFILN